MGAMFEVGVGVGIKQIDPFAEVGLDGGESLWIVGGEEAVVEANDGLAGFEAER